MEVINGQLETVGAYVPGNPYDTCTAILKRTVPRLDKPSEVGFVKVELLARCIAADQLSECSAGDWVELEGEFVATNSKPDAEAVFCVSKVVIKKRTCRPKQVAGAKSHVPLSERLNL